jgi:glycosyltransferase involved in cell wall biosynthesis
MVSALSRRVIVNSRYLAKAYRVWGDQGRLSVVYNGIDAEEFQRSRSESSVAVMDELDLPAGCKIVAMVGAVTPGKRIDLFVEVAKELLSSGIDAAFLVVGEGPAAYQRVIKDQVERHGLTSNFRFLGHRTDVGRILAASDVLVVTADEESFGRTIIEAMAARTPVVATRCGGPEEIIIDGVTGLLVPRNDVVAVSSAVRRLLTEALLGDGITQAASRRLSEQFSLDAYSTQVQRRIESAVE